jgi:hypothetical protein
MKRLLFFVTLSVLLFSSVAFAETVTLNLPYEKVWPAVVKTLTSDYQMEIGLIDKDSGLIQTKFKEFGDPMTGPFEFVKKIATVKDGVFEPKFRQGRYKTNITLTKNADGSTGIDERFTIELWMPGSGQVIGTHYIDGVGQYLPTNSTGYLESELIDKVKNSIKS